VDGSIRYVDVGGTQLAYQVTGEGPRDVVMAIDWASNLELTWAYVKTERFLRRIGSFARLILFDVRGMGLGVHIGARISELADAGELLVSSTVRDLVAGSGMAFEDRERHTLRGVPGEWQLFAAPT
jgi:class 3 adenylate cyclase